MPSLDVHDRPDEVNIDPAAHSISWLQNCLDLFYNEIPQAGIVTSTSITLTVNTPTVALPADFIMDVKHGVILPAEKRRLLRWPLQKVITASLTTTTGEPARYTVQGGSLRVTPTPKKTYPALLWYYAMPAVLGAADVPNFPSDFVLVEYVRLRALEWVHKLQPGTALTYARDQVAKLRKSGLFFLPEDDQIEVDPETFRAAGGDRNSWMGSTAVE